MGNYIPDTAAIQKEMLQAIGKESIDALYEDVPSDVRLKELHLPEGKPEMAVASAVKKIASQNKVYDSLFRGAGAYRHYIPAIVKGIEFVNTSDSAAVAEAIQPSFPTTERALLVKSVDSYKSINAYTANPVMTQESFDNMLDILTEAGSIESRVNFSDIIDNSIAEKILAEK